MDIELFFRIFDLSGTLVFALSGAIVAIKKQLDIYGIFILAIVTALGGGMIRDLLIGRTPPLVFTDGSYLAVSCLGTVLAIAGHRVVEWLKHPLRIMDAIGLGIFTVIGVKVALEAGASWYAAIMLGMVTGTGGGMLRDVLAKEVPLVLQREIYAVASMAGACAYIGWLQIPATPWGALPAGAGALLAAGLTAALRIVAIYQNWHLPRINDVR